MIKTDGPQSRITNYPVPLNAEIIERALTYSQITSSQRKSEERGETSCSQLIEKRGHGSAALACAESLVHFRFSFAFRLDICMSARTAPRDQLTQRLLAYSRFRNACIKSAREKNRSIVNASRLMCTLCTLCGALYRVYRAKGNHRADFHSNIIRPSRMFERNRH